MINSKSVLQLNGRSAKQESFYVHSQASLLQLSIERTINVYSFSIVFPRLYDLFDFIVATFSLQHGEGNMGAAMFLKKQMVRKYRI